MYSRTAHIRRTHASARLNKRLALAALLGTGACIAALLPLHDWPLTASTPTPSVAAADAPAATSPRGVLFAESAHGPAAQQPAVRHIYPYSIVPGGVTSQAELIRAIRSDPSVAAHYASFAVDKARLVTVAKAHGVYVSYRKNGQIYWTAKKIMLAEGETLLSDGVSEIRTRCGNRISDVPQMPIAPTEPSQEVLDTSIDVPVSSDADGVEHVSMAQGIGTTDHSVAGAPGNLVFANAAGLDAAMRAAPAPKAGALADAGNPAFSLANRNLLPYALVGTASAGAESTSPAVVATARSRTGVIGGASDTALRSLREGLATTGAVGSSGAGGTDAGGSNVGTGASGATGTATTSTSADGSTAGIAGIAGTGQDAIALSGAVSATKTDAVTAADGKTDTSTQAPAVAQQPAATTTTTTTTTPGKTPIQHADVPEPGSLWLSGAGIAAMLLLRRKRRPAA